MRPPARPEKQQDMDDFNRLRNDVEASINLIEMSAEALVVEDIGFQRTAYPEVATKLEDATSQILNLTNQLLKSASTIAVQTAPELENVDDVEINWKSIVDIVDSLLEKADTRLDEYTGLLKRKEAPASDAERLSNKAKPTRDYLQHSLRKANILKPQKAFDVPINVSEDGPWKPILTRKPHAKVSLEQSLGSIKGEGGQLQFKHPYEHEILSANHPPSVYQFREPVKYHPIDSTKATWVETYDGVLEMLEELKKAKEIAIDLEHHDYRTYTGLLSLMQISTRDRDWVVDTLQPWRQKLEILNEVFADPSILKVFHGAWMDIVWLQRDLGLYIVGLFDTFHAADALGYPQKSLAFLLKKFANFDADKKYQLADWRIRPLPDEMFYYARSDTHYLLYIYDMVRNEVLEKCEGRKPRKDLIQWVVDKSKETSLQRYKGLLADAETGNGPRGWLGPITKNPVFFSNEQFSVYRAVHQWRDQLARREDESPLYIMTTKEVQEIARIMPSDQKALASILRGDGPTRSHLSELMRIIREAKAAGATEPSMTEFIRSLDVSKSCRSGCRRMIGFLKGEETKNELATPHIDQLRSEKSQLWGSILVTYAGDVAKDSHEEMVDTVSALNVAEKDVTGGLSFVVPDRVRDQEYLGFGEEPTVVETNSSEIAAADPPSAAAEQNQESIVLNKGTKRARRQQSSANEKAAVNEAEAPFDYEAAQSVLHASKADDEDGDSKKKKKKKTVVFDPYAKKTRSSLPGARNLNYAKPGKTATFKK